MGGAQYATPFCREKGPVRGNVEQPAALPVGEGERDGVTLCVGEKDGVTLGVLVADDDGHCEGVTDAVREGEEPKDTVAVGVGGMQAVNTTLPL